MQTLHRIQTDLETVSLVHRGVYTTTELAYIFTLLDIWTVMWSGPASRMIAVRFGTSVEFVWEERRAANTKIALAAHRV